MKKMRHVSYTRGVSYLRVLTVSNWGILKLYGVAIKLGTGMIVSSSK